ncbi:hypothetical protein BV25DRAFT_1831295 [Artomyces pyxidatus]|uniref:Uncharacterized protein n=1 Tax=Artomyces pyxidatus TaxID=48021 RepID=A0ACB8SL64_9AGAM|nr:hypothetical protein BV25DRAFT_1831295 [Artomyces pyxidatus]
MSLFALPTELVAHIISYSLLIHPVPSCILATSKYFLTIALPLLYTHPRFTSVRALASFPASPVRRPHSVSVALAGGEVGRGAFREMEHLFMKCLYGVVRADATVPDPYTELKWLELDELSLCMHSTANSAADDIALEALSLVNPRRFVWTGPDPAHHFSTAIVPTACSSLFGHLGRWTHLQHLHLANISFPLSNYPHDAETEPPYSMTIPSMPALLTLYIGQATLVPVRPLAHLVCSPQMDALREVRLVDCYVGSIWGPRVRRGDVERAASALCGGGGQEFEHAGDGGGLLGETDGWRRGLTPEKAVSRVRVVVRCEALTERIIGGDRGEDLE